MTQALHTEDEALRFYRAALAVARRLDADSDARVLDADADAAWRAYGSDLPSVVRCDLVLANLAMLYPAAFAPGPVLDLPAWHEDDPWGAGFDRPPPPVIESLFASRAVPPSAPVALEQALASWGLAAAPAASSPSLPAVPAALRARLAPDAVFVVAGSRAVAAVTRAFVQGERLKPRTQVLLVSARPADRHALGVACALLADNGVPHFASPELAPNETWSAWADREKQRFGIARAHVLVTSSDASAGDIEAARALAAALGAADTVEIGED